jgi:hypothetical protein
VHHLTFLAKERGCAHPGCDVPAYLTEVHHSHEWANCQRTDIDDLTLRCGPDHKLITPGGWSTRKNHRGTIETIPPPHLDYGQPRTNTFHHPENLLRESEDDDEDP